MPRLIKHLAGSSIPRQLGLVGFLVAGVSNRHGQTNSIRQRYDGTIAGIDAQCTLDWSHLITAGAVGFARGVNDTPKIAALVLAAGAVTHTTTALIIAGAMALGGLLATRPVARTMSYRITAMNDGQAFTANLITAVLVIFASRWGMPVSTTHVGCGSLFGIGMVNRRGHWPMIGAICLAWVTTLPLAALLGIIAWRIIA